MFATLRRLFDRLALRPRTTRRTTAARQRHHKLTLEMLEDRLCPTTTDIWTGAGAAANLANPNDNWTNPLNWAAHVAPSPGDTLSFPATATTKSSNNDFPSGTIFGSLSFSGNNYQIYGNPLGLQNGITNSSGFNTINPALTLAAAQTFSDDSGASLVLNGAIDNGGNLLTVAANGTVLFDGSSISGSGGLTMNGTAKFLLENTAPDSYTGVTTVDFGTLYLNGLKGDAVVGNLVIGDGIGFNECAVVRLGSSNQIASTSAVSIAWTGLLDLNGSNNTIGPLTMSGGNITTGSGTLTLSSGVTTLVASTTAIIADNLSLGTGTTPQTFTVASGTANVDLNITATVSGGSGVTLLKAGLGTMQLTANHTGNTYLGQTLVAAGMLVAANAGALGAVSAGTTVNSGATLVYQDPTADSTYAFAAEPLTLNGGTLTVNGNCPLVTAAGPMTLAADSTIQDIAGVTLVLSGPISGSGGFTKAWPGEVDLSHANSYAGATVVNGGVLALDNAQSLGATGIKVAGPGTLELAASVAYSWEALTLAGTLFSNSNAAWTGPISLIGNATLEAATGSTLTVSGPISGPAANSLTIGAAANAGTVLLTSANTYAGATAVNVGTLAIANATALGSPAGKITNNGTTVAAGATLQLQGSVSVDPAESLTLNGSGVNGAGALLDAGGNDTWNGPVYLATTTTIGTNPGTTLTINGIISGPSTSNLIFVGGGTVVLAGADTFAGYTIVKSGILSLDNALALGGAPFNGGAGTTVDAGATVQLQGGITYAIEPLILYGTGVGGILGALESLTGSNTWSGPIKLGSDATITSAAGSTLTDNVQIANEGYTLTIGGAGNVSLGTTVSGAGGLTMNSTGTLTFATSAPNLYTGPTIVNAGTLFLAKPTGIQAITGAGVTINPGATLAGSGLINANVTNAGVVSPGGAGSIGTITINGNFTQTASGVLNIELASTKLFDQLIVTGVVNLGGTVNVPLLNGFQPPPGSRYTFLTFASSTGKFATVNLPKGLSIVYDPQDVTLVAS